MKTKLLTILTILIFKSLSLQAQDSWNKGTDFFETRSIGVSFAIGNKVYFGQGSKGGTNTVNDFWEYDLTSQTWKSINSILGNALVGATAFSYKNYGFVGFGQFSGTGFARAFHRFDSDSNKWVRIADFPGQGRNYAACFVIGNKAYIGCGYNGVKTFNDFYALNLDSNTWTRIADLPGLERASPFHFATAGKGYIVCGSNYTQSSGSTPLKDVYQYNPTTNTWVQLGDFPGENREDGASFSFESFGVVALGLSATAFTNEVWEFNGSTQTWNNRNQFSGAFRRTVAYSSNHNQGFVIGGNLGTGFTSEMYVYNPLTSSINANDISLVKPKVFPNPFIENFTIAGLDATKEYLVEIFDLKGSKVLELNYTLGEINAGLKPGSYFLRIQDIKDASSYSTIIIKGEN